MRKFITCILSLLMVLAIASTVFAQEEILNYRDFPPLLSDGTETYKPFANFYIAVKSPQGEIKASIATEDNYTGAITPGPVIQAAVGDTLVFADNSASQSGYKITAWDWQYCTEDKQVHELKSQIDKSLKLAIPGRYHFYLCVADNAPVKIGDQWLWTLNWSDNGNHRAIKDLGHGMQGYWYFNEIIVEVAEGSPDFYPTPEGSDQWQESYKTCAKTYTAMPGEDININFSLHNAGEKQTTDFAAAWFGSGWENPIWKVDNITLDKGEKQDFNLSVKVEPGQETRLVFLANLDGKTPAAESNQENNIMIIRITSNVNLSAVSIKAGASPPVTGGHYNGTVTFKNNSNVTLYNVPIAVFNNGYRTTLRDIFWTPVTQADFGPGETKQFTFQWTLCEYSKLEGVINVDPLTTVYPEDNYKDNKVMTVISGTLSGTGQQELTFQAWRQWSFIDVMGQPREYRTPNTARYTDIVETTLTPTNIKKVKYTVSQGESVDYTNTIAPPVPTCGDSCGAWNTMTDWEITQATLHYPAKSEGFSFGHPIWDNDWTYMSMKPQGQTAKTKFKEEWALDGAPVFDIMTQQMVGPPQHYTLRADYTVKVTYDRTCGYLVCETDDEGNTTCWCEYETTRGLTATFDYTGTGKILIDGTGIAPVPAQYVDDFRLVYPHLVEVPYPPENR